MTTGPVAADASRTAALCGTVEGRWHTGHGGEEHRMSDHTYRVTEIVGSSPEGVDQAVRNALSRASQTLRLLDWFEVTQIRGNIKNGEIEHFQVGLKVGFRLEDTD